MEKNLQKPQVKYIIWGTLFMSREGITKAQPFPLTGDDIVVAKARRVKQSYPINLCI